jgi:DNA-directed RNA polymerase subunit F
MTQPKPQPERSSRAIEVVDPEAPVINQAAIDLLTSWLEDDDEESIAEQRETWAYLKRVLDEDRLSDRKLFS